MQRVFAALVLLAICLSPAWAEMSVEQVQKLLADDGEALDGFGGSVALQGDVAIVGAGGPTQGATDSAYLFNRFGGVWSQPTEILPTDGEQGHHFGSAVAIDGDTLAIGAPGDWPPAYNERVYVYTIAEDAVSPQAILLPHWDVEDGSAFGSSLSLDGNTLVVGAWNDSCPSGEYQTGCVYVFTRVGDEWSREAWLNAHDSRHWDGFGTSVSVDGDSFAVGVPGAGDHPGGAVYVFSRTGGSWSQTARIVAEDGAPGDLFGGSVSLDGDTLLVGSSGDDDNGNGSGSAYFFVRMNGSWSQQAKVIPDDGEARTGFGRTVFLEGDLAVIGAPAFGDSPAIRPGSAYVFQRNGSGWVQEATIHSRDGSPRDYFGGALAYDDGAILIGAPNDDDHGNESGSAYVFHILSDPIDLLNALAANVRSLNLHHGTENSLLAKLNAALALLTDLVEDNDHAAQNVLGAFINQVEAQHGKKIPAEDADGLIEDARKIIGLLAEG